MKKLIDNIKLVIKKLKLSKINYLNSKFKKYIIKYNIENNKIKIINSNGDYKYVENNVPNKVKVMEIIKEHEIEIDSRILDYEGKSDDYKIIILSSGILLSFLGVMFIFSFFVGSYILFLLAFLSFSISLVLFVLNTYKIMINREEIKRLKLLKENKNIYEESEIKDIICDTFTYLKNYFYEGLTKIINLLEKNKSKI